MKVLFRSLCIGVFLMAQLEAHCQREVNFNAFVVNFVDGYSALELTPLQLSYVSNLQGIKSFKDIENQESFFLSQAHLLKRLDTKSLTLTQKLDVDIIDYEIQLNLERIDLEKAWLSSNTTIQESKLLKEAYGKEWYVYFLKKWIDSSVDPKSLYEFGLKEIKEVKRKIEQLKLKLNMDESEFKQYLTAEQFHISDSKIIQNQYEEVKKMVNSKAVIYFPMVEKIPEVSIKQGIDKSLAIVPAYYINNTFFYNFFNETYDVKTMGWVYMHEAIPGHHYQHHLRNLRERSKVQDLFRYYSFIEGWGAYVEQFGFQLGAYQNEADQYGQLEWDLIRSVRVAMDVGLNYYGWSDAKALNFWKQHITDKDEVAQREISRMKRWPAQVITYKYGAKMLNEMKGEKNSPSELKTFHTKVLKYGDVPFSILLKHFK